MASKAFSVTKVGPQVVRLRELHSDDPQRNTQSLRQAYGSVSEESWLWTRIDRPACLLTLNSETLLQEQILQRCTMTP
jgi:hypothetical protein